MSPVECPNLRPVQRWYQDYSSVDFEFTWCLDVVLIHHLCEVFQELDWLWWSVEKLHGQVNHDVKSRFPSIWNHLHYWTVCLGCWWMELLSWTVALADAEFLFFPSWWSCGAHEKLSTMAGRLPSLCAMRALSSPSIASSIIFQQFCMVFALRRRR